MIGVRDDDVHLLGLVLQSYGLQTLQPIERALLDYGSKEANSKTYRRLARRYGWQYVKVWPRIAASFPAAQHNFAASLLSPEVAILFRGQPDAILPAGVIEAVTQWPNSGVTRLPTRSLPENSELPDRFEEAGDLDSFIEECGASTPDVLDEGGCFACPFAWFVESGGHDLRFKDWGFEDTELRLRAEADVTNSQIDTPELPTAVTPPKTPKSSRPLARGLRTWATERINSDSTQVRNGGLPVSPQWQGWLQPLGTDIIERYGLTSIVIVAHNQFELTLDCIDSIRRRTKAPYELILVDNHSTDETPDYAASADDIRLITNDENLGFPAAANQGIRDAQGDQVLLLNNDTLVTPGWLERMLDTLRSDKRIGLVGPVSNNVSGAQVIDTEYSDTDGMLQLTTDRADNPHLQPLIVPRLVGFCLLVKRQIFDTVGLFDEEFGIGNFEDDDLCLRARKTGYACAIEPRAFVHHIGHGTFDHTDHALGELIASNLVRFENKWDISYKKPQDRLRFTPGLGGPEGGGFTPAPGMPAPGSCVAEDVVQAPRAIDASQSAPLIAAVENETTSEGLVLQHARPLISLCMICRDNEDTIGSALESIRPYVDELVVVDTGSTDETPHIAKRLGARVFEFPWCDDFSAARNESIRRARGRWILWMDSDDTIPPEQGQRLREKILTTHTLPGVMGVVMQVHCPAGDGGDYTAVDHVKAFRNRPDLRFEGRIHEQVLMSIRRAGGEVAWSDIHIVHSGSDNSAEGRSKKHDRDLRLLELQIQDEPGHTFVLFNLGMTHADMGEHKKAGEYLRQSIEAGSPGESHIRKAYALLTTSLRAQSILEEAEATCLNGIAHYPNDPELQFLYGGLRFGVEDYERAIWAYQQVVGQNGDDNGKHFSSIDAGVLGHKAWANLAVCHHRLQQYSQSAGAWQQVLKHAPSANHAARGFADALFHLSHRDGLESQKTQATEQDLSEHANIYASRIALLDRNLEAAISALAVTVPEEAGRASDFEELAPLLFEGKHWDLARDCLKELTTLQPDNASAHQNLGVCFEHLGNHHAAIKALEQSLAIRPDYAPAQHLLEACIDATSHHAATENP